MPLVDDLLLTRPLPPGDELAVSVLLTREALVHFMDQRVFRPAGITDQQYNVLRILKGGPAEGHTIGDIKRRVIVRNADVPRLVDRLAALGLVARIACPKDRRACRVQLTPEGEALKARVDGPFAAAIAELEALLAVKEQRALVAGLERLREGLKVLTGMTQTALE